MSEAFSEVGFRPDVMDLLEPVCMCVKFTKGSNGRESFHQLNTFTLSRGLNEYSVFITFIDTHTHTSMHTQMHKNKRTGARSRRSCHTVCVYNYRGSEPY